MKFSIYHITHQALKPYLQYILFNKNEHDPFYNKSVISYSNTNICLGIVNNKELTINKDQTKSFIERPGISSYLSALYLRPHVFKAEGLQDEICIDFTPQGFLHFFPFACKTYILQEDILNEAFGKRASDFFEAVFAEEDLIKRGEMIERFFLSRCNSTKVAPLSEALELIHFRGDCSVKELADTMQLSEKSLYRLFTGWLDISPKKYLRIVRFRAALNLIHKTNSSFTSIAFQCGYTDPSHFYKDFKLFTNLYPEGFKKSTLYLEQKILVKVS
ncbi:MAG: hypothetical protein JWN76_2452 [Chitinophagaceae bacterium]|nr:hypothetical protein [Chitinophagaceae bacterium]